MNKKTPLLLGIDSMIMIYLLKQDPLHLQKILKLFHEADLIIISTFLYGEVLTGYYRENEHVFAEQLLAFAEASEKIQICNFNLEAAKKFAALRAQYKISPPDAIHLASALTHGATAFLTNDKELKKVGELKIIYLNDL